MPAADSSNVVGIGSRHPLSASPIASGKRAIRACERYLVRSSSRSSASCAPGAAPASTSLSRRKPKQGLAVMECTRI